MSRASDRLREFIEAFDLGSEHPWHRLVAEEWRELDAALDALALEPRSRECLAAVAREMADVKVTVEGAALALGIDLDAAFDAVMDANMAKLPMCQSCDGRGWTPLEGATVETPHGTVVEPMTRCCGVCHGTGKGKPIRRDDGKVMRPPDWTPPDLSGAVR